MQPIELEGRVAELLRAHKTMVLASAGGEVSPWVAATYFAETDPFTLFVAVETGGKTMANVRARPRVAVLVAAPHPFTLFAQGEGVVTVIEGAERARSKADLIAKSPEMEPFFAAPMEHLRIDVTRWLLTDVPNGWLPARELRAPTSGNETG